MRKLMVGLGALTIIASLLFGMGGSASAAHLGNNKAELVGTLDAEVTGISLVNFKKGEGDFNASASATGLAPNAVYTFLVRSAAGIEREICSAETTDKGMFMCMTNNTLPDQFGFNRAVIRDASGIEVAVGTYERSGNCRVPDQAGSQCEASRHHKH